MPDIGAYDARTHLPKLLERVQRGESLRDLAHSGHRTR